MARVFSENGFVGHVFPDDHNPPHVHVFKAGSEIRINIETFGFEGPHSMSDRDANAALDLVIKHSALCWKKWRQFHG